MHCSRFILDTRIVSSSKGNSNVSLYFINQSRAGALIKSSSMKKLILVMTLLLVSSVVTAQSTFLAAAEGKSKVCVQDLKTGVEYSFETNYEVVVPIIEGHDYFISVTGKKSTKVFILKETDSGLLDDAFFDTASCDHFNLVAPVNSTAYSEESIYAIE